MRIRERSDTGQGIGQRTACFALFPRLAVSGFPLWRDLFGSVLVAVHGRERRR